MSEQVPESKDKWDNLVNFLAKIKSSPGPLDDQSIPRNPHPADNIHHCDIKTEMISYLAPFSQQYYLETSLNDRPILKENMMSMTKDILVYTDTVDVLKIWSLHNLKANLEIKLHQSPIIEVSAYNPHRTSVPNPLIQEFKDHKINLFGTIDQQGFLKIWTASLYEPDEKIVHTTLMSTQLPEIGKEVKMKFKSPLVFLTVSDADITVWYLSPNHFDCLKDSHSQNQNNYEGITAQGPSRFHTQGFESKIRDADFSQKNDLIYVCFENNLVRILNVERLDVIKSFEPHIEHPHDHLAKILAYRNIFKPLENKEAIPNDFSLKDIFLTVSNRLEIKVWDLSQITEKGNEGCIGHIKARPNCENEEKPQNPNENLVAEFDFTRNFMFVLWRLKEENILLIYHIDKRFYVYDEETMKNPPLFFDSLKEYKLQSKPIHQIQVINLHDEESKLYFLTEEIACKAANQLNEIQKEENLSEKKDNYGVCDSKTFFAIFCLYNDFFNFNLILSDDAYPMYLIEDLDKIEKNEGIHAKPEEESKKDGSGGQAIIEETPQVFPPPLPDFLIKMQQETKLKTEEPPSKTEKAEDNTKMETEDQNVKAFKTIQEDFLSKAQAPFFAQSFLQNQGYLHNPYPSNPYSNIYAPGNFNHNPYNNNFHNPMMTAPLQMNNNMNATQRYPGKNKNHKKPKTTKNPPIVYQPRPEPKKPETNNDESKSDIRSPSENYIAPILTEEPKNNNNIKTIDEKSIDNNNSIKSPGLPQQNVNQTLGINPSGEAAKGKTKEKEKDNDKEKEKEKEKEKMPQEDFFDKMTNFFERKLERMKEDLEKSMEKKLEALKPNSRMIIEDRPAEINLPKDFQIQFNKLFAEQFEKSVTPCFEKYLIKIFEQVNNTFEKGQKFFIEKVNVEQIKSQNIRESLQEALKIFMQISNSLSENLNNNVKNNAKMEVFYIEKQTQLNKMIENVNDVIRKERELQDKIAEIEKNLQGIMIPIKEILENNGKSGMMDEEDEKKTKDREQKESKEKETTSNLEGNYDPMSYYKQSLLGSMNTNQYVMQPQQISYQDQRQPQMQPYVQTATPYFNPNFQGMPGYQNQPQPPNQSNNYQFVNQMNPLSNEATKQQQLPNPYQLNQPQQNQNPGGVFKFPNEIQTEQKLQDINAFLLSNLAKLQLPLSSYPQNLNSFQANPMDKNQQIQPINTSNKPGNQMQNMGGFNVNYGPQNSNPSQMQINPQGQNFQETPKSMNLSSFHLGFLPFYNPNDIGMVPSMTMNSPNQNVSGNQVGNNLNKPKQDN